MQLEIRTKTPATRTHTTPILFVHGMFHAAWCWSEYFQPYFAERGYVTHALSLRGHGASPGREHLRWTPLADYVADVAQVVAALPEPPVLVGHSMGGMVVQKHLATHPAPAVVLLGSASPNGVLFSTWRFGLRHPLAILRVGLALRVFPMVRAPGLYRDGFFSDALPEAALLRYHEQVQDESFRAMLDLMAPGFARPKAKTPLLVLGSADDALISPPAVEATARAFGVPAYLFSGMGHAMMLDVGWQAVADRILGWLEAQGL